MTTLNHNTTLCAWCGQPGEHTSVASYSNFGYCDLDLRPPRMERDIIHLLVHRCQKCGFCAEDISRIVKDVKMEDGSIEEILLSDFESTYEDIFDDFISVIIDLFESEAYKDQLNDKSYPELANSFLCKALFEIELESLNSAVWSTLNAAWVCDDEDNYNSAKACRNKTLEIIDKAHSDNQRILWEDETDAPLQVDLLRRSSRFEEALNIIQNERSGIENDQLKRMLDYQSSLIQQKDDKCHRVPGDDNDYE